MQAEECTAALPECPMWAWPPLFAQRVDADYILATQESADAIHMAAQLGRLDVVSLILGLFALLLGLAAIMGFWLIRGAAVHAATIEARRVAEAEAVPEARRATIEWLESQGVNWSRLVPQSSEDTDGDQAFADALSGDGGK